MYNNKFSIKVSEYVNYRIQEFSLYMKTFYREWYSGTGLYDVEKIIQRYIDEQDKFDDMLVDKIYKIFTFDIIPKQIICSNDTTETYHTYFRLNNYRIKLTCIQDYEENIISIENIVINSK
jgi:hypothetical protein